MRRLSRRNVSLLVGVLGATGLFLLAEAAFGLGYFRTARVILWQSAFLQALVPTPNLGTVELPVYEGTPLHLLAWYVGAFAGIPIYAGLAFFVSRLWGQRRAP